MQYVLIVVAVIVGVVAGLLVLRTPRTEVVTEVLYVHGDAPPTRRIGWSEKYKHGTYAYENPDGVTFTYGPGPDGLGKEEGWIWDLRNRNLWTVGFGVEQDCPGFWDRHPELKANERDIYREYLRKRQ